MLSYSLLLRENRFGIVRNLCKDFYTCSFSAMSGFFFDWTIWSIRRFTSFRLFQTSQAMPNSRRNTTKLKRLINPVPFSFQPVSDLIITYDLQAD